MTTSYNRGTLSAITGPRLQTGRRDLKGPHTLGMYQLAKNDREEVPKVRPNHQPSQRLSVPADALQTMRAQCASEFLLLDESRFLTRSINPRHTGTACSPTPKTKHNAWRSPKDQRGSLFCNLPTSLWEAQITPAMLPSPHSRVLKVLFGSVRLDRAGIETHACPTDPVPQLWGLLLQWAGPICPAYNLSRAA
jgi:hypothetical protein